MQIANFLALMVLAGCSSARSDTTHAIAETRGGSSPARTLRTIRVPYGSAIQIDGRIGPKEWERASAAVITVSDNWSSRALIKHDNDFLYFLFEGVKHDGKRLFPEILIDPHNRKGNHWEKGQWWFHVSANLCEGDGEPNVYRKNGVFQCAHTKDGWDGNNPPASDTTNIEIRVSFAKLNLRPASHLTIGLALALTDATGDIKQKWFYWPDRARIDLPRTWGVAILD